MKVQKEELNITVNNSDHKYSIQISKEPNNEFVFHLETISEYDSYLYFGLLTKILKNLTTKNIENRILDHIDDIFCHKISEKDSIIFTFSLGLDLKNLSKHKEFSDLYESGCYEVISQKYTFQEFFSDNLIDISSKALERSFMDICRKNTTFTINSKDILYIKNFQMSFYLIKNNNNNN